MTVLTAATTPTPFSRRSTKKNISSPQFQASSSSSHDHPPKFSSINIPRRSITFGLTAVLMRLVVEENGSALAAARRPPPPPPTDKKDPNVSGVLAKVLASKKRKEEMKQAMAKLREKGKPIN